jgi:hypothetical protein
MQHDINKKQKQKKTFKLTRKRKELARKGYVDELKKIEVKGIKGQKNTPQCFT